MCLFVHLFWDLVSNENLYKSVLGNLSFYKLCKNKCLNMRLNKNLENINESLRIHSGWDDAHALEENLLCFELAVNMVLFM